MVYNTAAMRELLMAAFTEEEFKTFCFDHAHHVHQQFTVGQPQSTRVQLLIEYTIRTGSIEPLLKAVEQANPYQFSACKPRLSAKSETDTDDHAVMVQMLPLPLQKYDHFFDQWVQTLSSLDLAPQNYARSVIAGLATALHADLGFVLVNQGVTWEPTIALDHRATRAARQLTGNSRMHEILNQALRYRHASFVGPLGNIEPLLFVPLVGAAAPSLLIFTGLRGSYALDSTIGTVLETILATTHNLSMPIPGDSLELNVYHGLRNRIGSVSDAMDHRQFELYTRRLQKMTVHFEPIVYLHPVQPYIWGWEALARDPETQSAPVDVFDIAEVWGRRFQLELDMYFLQTAINAYVYETDPRRIQQRTHRMTAGTTNTERVDRFHRSRRGELQSLTVNVSPETLIRTRYYELMREIYLAGTMPLNKLTLEISEKSPLPKPDPSEGAKEPYEWFRGYLRRLEQLDVRFAIDDFGVGYASSDRLSRLGVSVVKIDRNALLHTFGDSTIHYVTDVARTSPGSVQVIVKGVDYDSDSLFPLRALYDAGIRYVQGHRFGAACPDVNRLTEDDMKHIRIALQGPSAGR